MKPQAQVTLYEAHEEVQDHTPYSRVIKPKPEADIFALRFHPVPSR